MSIWQKITPWRKSEPETATFVESAGVNIDCDDDEGWRKLSGDGKRDITPMTRTRMLKLSHYLWESNLMANRLIELPIAYLLAKGVRVVIDDEEMQGVIDRHWNDGLNAWDIKLPKKVRELSLFGEQAWVAFTDEFTGFVRWGYLDPANIETVVTDPDNCEQPIGIVTKKNRKGESTRYKVICNVPETAFAKTAQQIRETMSDGRVLYFKINDLCSGSRGRSDLLAQIDWLDAYDQFLFGELDRADFMRAFVWDVKLTGATPEEVKQRAKEITAPSPGSVRVHNEGEEWSAVSPELSAADGDTSARLFRNQILGGATIPEHWYGGASEVNRSTGESMSEPTEKTLQMRQMFVGHMLVQAMTYVLHQWLDNTGANFSEAETAEYLSTLRCEWPEMTSKDSTKYAAALQQAVIGANIAVTEGLMTRKTAIQIVSTMAIELGVEFDAAEEFDAVTKEMAAMQANDTFVPDPAELDDIDQQSEQ